jgi:hypothetical protein
MRYSRLLAFSLFAGVYALGNIGGNFYGWDVIFRWLEEANGIATIDPVWTHPLVLLALAIFASGGQLWREWFGVEDKWKWIIYVIMAADLGINTIGFYYLVMGTFSFPPVWGVFLFLAALAFIPNVVCQSLATINLKVLLSGSEGKQRSKDKRPAMPPATIQPATFRAQQSSRRSNGAIPLDVEELQL